VIYSNGYYLNNSYYSHVALDDSGVSDTFDLLWSYPFTAIKNSGKNSRFYVKAVISNDYYYGNISIDKTYTIANNYSMKATNFINFNPESSQLLEAYRGCLKPNIIFTQNYSISAPYQILRSKMLTLSSATYFDCDTTYTYTLQWSADLLNSTTFEFIKQADFSTNPTTSQPDLIFKENTLVYGLYHFKFRATVYYYNKQRTNEVDTYIEILPTGIAIFGIEFGVSSVKIGSSQSINLINKLKKY
jgi:hypothetical protein